MTCAREVKLDEKRRYRSRKPDLNRLQVSEWGKKNPEKVRAKRAIRRLAQKAACPEWADRDAISAVYAEAVRLSKETGTPHEVDHIVPIRGKTVCGLHVHWNLRAIPASENHSKGARPRPSDGVAYW